MTRNLVVLEDGTEIFSGGEGSAVMALTLTECVNTGKELMPGGVCATMAELTLLDMGQVHIGAGDALTLYDVEPSGARSPVGVFLAEKPERNESILTVTAYDRLILLDKDLTGWLRELNGWPYSLQSFCQMVFEACGLGMAEQEIPNGAFAVAQFSADGVTGRQLIRWAAEAAGCFCRLNGQGQAEFCWYTPAPVSVGPEAQQEGGVECLPEAVALTVPSYSAAEGAVVLTGGFLKHHYDGAGTLTLTLQGGSLQQYYYQCALSLEEYRTASIQRVQLRQDPEDVGTIFPQDVQGNTLAITGNPLLSAKDAQTLVPVAQTLWQQFAGICYTPCVLELPHTPGLRAGQVLTVHDAGGQTHSVYIMELVSGAGGMRITCTGSASRDSSFAVNDVTQSTKGKLLQLRLDVDGLRLKNSENQDRWASLSVTVEGLQGQVAEQKGLQSRVTRLEQSAQALQLSVEQVREEGADKIKTGMGYTFDDKGLRIAAIGQEMQNLLDHTGMYVTRGGQTVLQANHTGVTAVDVTVKNYLIVGEHARFEDYEGSRTACFHLGGTV